MKRFLSLALLSTLLLVPGLVVGQQAAAPPPPAPYGVPITLAQAKKVLAGAEAEAMKNKWNVVITVVDTGGNIVALHRMDDAQFGSLEVARQKAYTAVAFRRPTKVFQDAIEKGGVNLRLLRLEGASPLEGGIPIMADGKIIGAIGVSGVTSEQDAQIARAGIESMK
jgi:glc operon protein GlcG